MQALQTACPGYSSWQRAGSIDRVLLASRPGNLADTLVVLLLKPGVPAAEASCLLETSTAPCAQVRLRLRVVREVPGGFAALYPVNGRFVVAVSEASELLETLAPALGTEPLPPFAATLDWSLLPASSPVSPFLREFLSGSSNIDMRRAGSTFTLQVRPHEASP